MMRSILNPTTVMIRAESPKVTRMLSSCCCMMARPSASTVRGLGNQLASQHPQLAARAGSPSRRPGSPPARVSRGDALGRGGADGLVELLTRLALVHDMLGGPC